MWKYLNPERTSCGFRNIRIRVDGALVPCKTPHPNNNKLCYDNYHQFILLSLSQETKKLFI